MPVKMLDYPAMLSHLELLHDEMEVTAAYERIAREIDRDYHTSNPVVITVLTGGMIPTIEITNRLRIPLELDFLHATRYQGQLSGGEIAWMVSPRIPIEGRNILIIDDILDEGDTLKAIVHFCQERKAANIRSVVLARKNQPQKIQADYIGFTVPANRYLVGCGMDYRGHWRHLRAIYTLIDDPE